MKVVFHLGAHSTDEDRLVRVLANNPKIMEQYGIAVPPPQKYRMVLRDALVNLHGEPASQDIQDAIIEACADTDEVNRLIFSHEFFLCIPERVITRRGFYTMAGSKLPAMADTFMESIEATFNPDITLVSVSSA